jgi:transposase
MIPVPSSVQVWLTTGHTDMRKGFDGLALLVQETLKRNPHNGHLFVFRGRRGSLIKVLWHDGQGMCLFAKRLERGRFIWPSTAPSDAADRTVTITPAQLGFASRDWLAAAATQLETCSRRLSCREKLRRIVLSIHESQHLWFICGVATTSDQLPDNVDALKAALIETRAKLSGATALIEHLQLVIAKMKREMFGPRSERSQRLIDQLRRST